MSDQLGPLPEPDFLNDRAYWSHVYSAANMRAYAAAEVAKERERWEHSLNAARGALADIATSVDMTLELAQRKAWRVYSETEARSQHD